MDWNELAHQIHADNVAKGFWDDDRTYSMTIALIHSEVTELLEAFRKGNPPSAKIDCSLAEEELADIVIRLLDAAPVYGWEFNGLDLQLPLLSLGSAICNLHLLLSKMFEEEKLSNYYAKHLLEDCLNFAKSNEWDLIQAIELKLAYNRTRPIKHGKEF
jgi:NTP pyrophosphatase (non-canonical NTP hydrolase)